MSASLKLLHNSNSLQISISGVPVPISVRHADAGDAVASPMLKNWPLFRNKFSKFGQSIQLHSHVSEVVSIFQTKAK